MNNSGRRFGFAVRVSKEYIIARGLNAMKHGNLFKQPGSGCRTGGQT
jgi:hypothetical protein